MLQRWLLREPSLCFGLPVYLFAALVLPLHLGWTGTAPAMLLAYLLFAAALFSGADALVNSSMYRAWRDLASQAMLSLLALAVPSALAFYVGTLAGPVDEAMDEEACAAQGVQEVDSLDAEADDTFDVTPDCTGGR